MNLIEYYFVCFIPSSERQGLSSSVQKRFESITVMTAVVTIEFHGHESKLIIVLIYVTEHRKRDHFGQKFKTELLVPP